MAFLRPRTSRPNKETNLNDWNETWEEDLRSYNQLSIRNIASLPSPSSQMQQYGEMMMPQIQLYFDRTTRDICDLQNDIREYALPRLLEGFESKWKALSETQRHDIALESIYNTCNISTDMESHRKWCPEATKRGLTGKDGQAYMKMLLAIVDNDVPSKVEPIFFAHPIVDELVKTSMYRIIAPGLRLHRCYFLSMVIWKMFLAFYGDSESHIIAKSPNQSRARVPSKIRNDALKSLGPEGRAYVEEAVKDRPSGQVRVCWNCRRDEAHLGSNQVLKACSKCKGIGRTIHYCSSECQKHDWKHGKPRPHKLTCGKDSIDPSIYGTQTEPQKPSKIPMVEPPFKRTLALQYQVSLLEKGKDDYVIMRPNHDHNVGIIHPFDQIRTDFLVMRQRALKTGCPGAVVTMYRLLKFGLQNVGVSEVELRSQLESEFGIPNLDAVDVMGMEAPTEKELEDVRFIISADGTPYAVV